MDQWACRPRRCKKGEGMSDAYREAMLIVNDFDSVKAVIEVRDRLAIENKHLWNLLTWARRTVPAAIAKEIDAALDAARRGKG